MHLLQNHEQSYKCRKKEHLLNIPTCISVETSIVCDYPKIISVSLTTRNSVSCQVYFTCVCKQKAFTLYVENHNIMTATSILYMHTHTKKYHLQCSSHVIRISRKVTEHNSNTLYRKLIATPRIYTLRSKQ